MATKRVRIPEELSAVLVRLEHVNGLEEATRFLLLDVDEAIATLVDEAETNGTTGDFGRWAESLTSTNCGHVEYRLGQLMLTALFGGEEGEEE
mgnify:CR=1 FL=1